MGGWSWRRRCSAAGSAGTEGGSWSNSAEPQLREQHVEKAVSCMVQRQKEKGAGFPRAPLRSGCGTSLLYSQHISLHCTLQIDFNKPDFNHRPTAGFILPQQLYSLVLSLCKYMGTRLYL